ncbi:uncharacterized protein LOC128312093 [Acinonyx jubatus]|uniref:Uncharacterized protein LOC128312093 n=1 Tax=Acinonyx jubatus TaxID=32536 RepID=A0ABM3NM44_ACIJB|nr:uncharacterized protein LOC128312093 [Acinonyx jubatus]
MWRVRARAHVHLRARVHSCACACVHRAGRAWMCASCVCVRVRGGGGRCLGACRCACATCARACARHFLLRGGGVRASSSHVCPLSRACRLPSGPWLSATSQPRPRLPSPAKAPPPPPIKDSSPSRASVRTFQPATLRAQTFPRSLNPRLKGASSAPSWTDASASLGLPVCKVGTELTDTPKGRGQHLLRVQVLIPEPLLWPAVVRAFTLPVQLSLTSPRLLPARYAFEIRPKLLSVACTVPPSLPPLCSSHRAGGLSFFLHTRHVPASGPLHLLLVPRSSYGWSPTCPSAQRHPHQTGPCYLCSLKNSWVTHCHST